MKISWSFIFVGLSLLAVIFFINYEPQKNLVGSSRDVHGFILTKSRRSDAILVEPGHKLKLRVSEKNAHLIVYYLQDGLCWTNDVPAVNKHLRSNWKEPEYEVKKRVEVIIELARDSEADEAEIEYTLSSTE